MLTTADLDKVAYQSFVHSDYEKSADLYRQLTALAPENYDYWLGLARSLSWLGRGQEAEAACVVSIILKPDEPSLYFHRGTFRQQQKNYTGAIEDYKRFLRDSALYDYWVDHAPFELGRCFEALGEYQTSLKWYTHYTIASRPYVAPHIARVKDKIAKLEQNQETNSGSSEPENKSS